MNTKEIIQLHSAIKEKIVLCTEPQQIMFKRMYSHRNLDLPILDVVDNMQPENLKRALQQIEATLKKQ